MSEASKPSLHTLAPLGPKIRSIRFPFANHLAKQQVLPYLFVEDLEDGDVVVMEEAPLGRYTFTKKPLLGVITRSHLGVTLDFETPARKDPPNCRRSIVRLKTRGRIFTPGGLPAISTNQRSLSIFNP